MRKIAAFFLLCWIGVSNLSAQNSVHHFQTGEKLTYSIYYYLWGVWVGAGEVTFSVSDELFEGKEAFQFKGYGTTYPRYDWFYKVEDTYISNASKSALKPFRFYRNVNEGSDHYVEENLYDYESQSIYSSMKFKDEPTELDTIKLKPKSLDPLTLLYQTRNLDFSSFEEGQKIPIRMVIDGEVFELYIRFLGTEVYDHSEWGEIDCYLFSALLVDGTIFKGGENLKVWVTKDENAIPVYVQSEIRVGSIRSELKTYSGIKSGKISLKN